jgi:hypothetical protein
MEMQQVSVTLTGKTMGDVLNRAAEFLAGAGATTGARTTQAAVTARTAPKARVASKTATPAAIEEDALDLSADEVDLGDGEELSDTDDDALAFDDEPVAPAKTAAAAKKSKVPNAREMQTAGLTYTRAHGKGKDHTLKLLSKALRTKISSISEITDEKQIIAAYKFLTA